ncbi:MAG: hypothetical protein IPL95_08290 [Saprospiraceae bacterium]|nr:hypothetical protein [Saprospiraceae bacterium]
MQIGNTVSAYNWLSLAIHHGFCFKWVLENDSIWKEQKYTPQWNNTMSNFIEKVPNPKIS